MTYDDFLASKNKEFKEVGFEVDSLNHNLFPFQGFCVRLALKKGRFAIFADCGLGKTLMQLEWANQVANYVNGWVIVVAPLAVTEQTIEEGKKFGIYVQDYFEAERNGDLYNLTQGILITNYEQLKNIDLERFIGVVLDESSILKSLTGKLKTYIIKRFNKTPYKLACTATPSPNDVMEMCNHAEFLNVAKRTEVLAQYFTHDGGNTSKWKIKGHAKKKFYSFVCDWAVMFTKPSDLGFDDVGYNLPKLNISDIEITTEQRDDYSTLNEVSVSATGFNKELKLTLVDRIDRAADIVNSSNENWIVWLKQNPEAEYAQVVIKDSINVQGSDKPEVKKKNLLGFAKNEFRVLVTKPKIAQYGLNYQNCHNQIFPSLDFSFESLYQAIRRSYRFGQQKPVNIYIITTDTMQNVIAAIKYKQQQFEEMKNEMSNTFKEKYLCTNYMKEIAA